MKRSKINRRRAFTLVELLVVIGLIAVLAGVLGLALGRGNSGIALQSAQSTGSAMLSGARGQAAARQADAAVLVNVSATSENFLRELVIATSTDGGTNWIATNTRNILPSGIFLVPGNASVAGGYAATNVTFSTTPNWTALNKSISFAGSNITLRATDGTALSSDVYRSIARFTPRGTTNPTDTITRVVFAPGDQTAADVILFNNPSALRGMTISTYGIATLLNDADSF